MNNFFLNQDPLLANQQAIIPNPIIYQQPRSVKDSVGELDKILRNLSPAVMERLQNNSRFNELNGSFQANVQQELLSLVREHLNANSGVVSNINEQIRIIDETKSAVENEKEESLNEMNDYMKNYSHLTFDEYKKMKNGEPIPDKKKKCGIL